MFELFIALFGGAFYVGKYLIEAVKLKVYEERQLARTITLESIKARYVASYEMEQWARYFISSGEHYDDICNWFAEDFQYVLGKDWKEKLHIPKKVSADIMYLWKAELPLVDAVCTCYVGLSPTSGKKG